MELGINFDSTAVHRGVGARDRVRAAAGGAADGARLLAVPRLASSSTLNVVLAIPMSLLGTVAVIYFLGFTLNTFTLLALSLAVGIVVDDAIMVLENIFRHAERGKDRVRAAREGTTEITFAALAATLAVVAIFLPVVFMKGVDREVLPAVRRDALRGGAAVVPRGDHARAGALRAAPRRPRASSRSRVGRCVDRGVRPAGARLRRRAGAGPAPPGPGAAAGGAALLVARRRSCSARLPSEFVPVAGPEPPHRAPADRGRLRPRGDRPLLPARRGLRA